jgi:N-acetylglucosamine-6-sulfatase
MPRAANNLSASGRVAAAVAIALLGAAVAALAAGDAAPADPKKRKGKPPNIVVIVTDEQVLDSFRSDVMPKTYKHLVDDGTTFENFVVSDPNCCPSRATFITGQYAHNTRVFANNPGYESLKDKNNVLPVWLKEAGYTTAHVGKFLNKYGQAVKDEGAVAPGWDEWHAALEPRRYYDYDLKVNGRTVHYGKEPDDYLTRVLAQKAVTIIGNEVPEREPLFLQFAPFAPHVGPSDPTGRCKGAAVPDPLDSELFVGEPTPNPPSYDEADIEDKPSFIRRLPPLEERDDESVQTQWECGLASLHGVDRAIADIVRALKQQGELGNTTFIFWSDNGYMNGEHRLRKKAQGYQEAIHVPLVIRPPAGLKGGPSTISAPAANIDLAPTILKLANAEPCRSKNDCRVMDGRSLVPLMRGEGEQFPTGRHIVIEFKLQKDRSRRGSTCSFAGLWKPGEVYIEHRRSVVHPESTRECEKKLEYEHYDLNSDPFQLDNLAYVPDSLGETTRADSQLQPLLDSLRRCSGIEGRDPQPRKGSYCE